MHVTGLDFGGAGQLPSRSLDSACPLTARQTSEVASGAPGVRRWFSCRDCDMVRESMASRLELLRKISGLVGGALSVNDPQDGWPARATLQLLDREIHVALHVGTVGLSHRERDDVERRFQNPGKNRPVASLPGAVPLLVGLSEEGDQPVLVGFDAARRVGIETRQSLFVPLDLLQRAANRGWAEHKSGSGERIVGMHPPLLPLFAELIVRELPLDPEQVSSVLDASGLLDMRGVPPIERAKRATLVLVRRAAFGKDVVTAYAEQCAMCGLNLGLVQGAHIYPVSAPASPDIVGNGLSLCGNHHSAFDRHLIWVSPESLATKLHPAVLRRATESPAARTFAESTLPALMSPRLPAQRPDARMFAKRYEYYTDQYDWAD